MTEFSAWFWCFSLNFQKQQERLKNIQPYYDIEKWVRLSYMKRVGKSVLVTVTVKFSFLVPQKFVCILDEISMLMFDVIVLAGKGF